MLTFNCEAQPGSGVGSAQGQATSDAARRTALLRNILETREVRLTIGVLIPEVISVWAGGSWFKRIIAAIINRVLKIGFFQPSQGQYSSLMDSKDIFNEAGPVVSLINEGTEKFTDACSQAFDSMTLEEKATLIQGIIGGLFNGRSGKMITQMGSVLNAIHDQEPEFLARALEPGLSQWVKNTDFGELKEFTGKSSADFQAVIKMVNDKLWQYPAKVVLLLSLLPDVANLLAGGMRETVSRFNEVSPDLVTDIILSLLREIDGEELGRGINEFTELIRKIATGSALIGDPGFPKMPQDVALFYNDILATLDTEKMIKAGAILAEQKLLIKKSLLDQLRDRPEVILKTISHNSSLKNAHISFTQHWLTVLEELPGQDVAEAITRGIGVLDTDTLAEIINLTVTLISQTHQLQPEAIPNLVSKLMAAIDIDLVAETSDELMDEVMPDLIPLGRAMLPQLMHGLCDALEPQEDAYETDLAEARKRLWRLLSNKEG